MSGRGKTRVRQFAGGRAEKKSGVLSVVHKTQGFLGRKLPRGLLYLLS